MATLPKPTVVDVDGRSVSVYEYGDPAGAPVMVFHGIPASGAGFAWADAPARERGLRLVAPDRPGVGSSTRVAQWTVADYPPMVAALADQLGLTQFAVWGYSGGGPYAVACAALLPDRATATAVAAGMGQAGVWAVPGDFEKTDKQMLELAIKRPWQARVMLGLTGRLARRFPQAAMKSFEKQLSASDRAVVATLGSPAEVMALFTEAFTHGAAGVVDDYAAVAQPWGVNVEEIQSRVAIFQGDADTMVPARHSEELAKRIPNATLTIWPGEGHLGTVTHVGEVLDALR